MVNHSDAVMGSVQVQSVRFEHLREALGIGTATPRLSWISETASQNWQQVAYALEARAADAIIFGETGRVDSNESVLVAWPFAPLRSRERLQVRVKVWGNDGSESAWSEWSTVEAGLLETSDWSAHFITPTWDEDKTAPQPNPMLRRNFTVRGPIAQARLYITALGVYEAEINGQRVGDLVMAPGWTYYNRRLRYNTFDVTSMLNEGENAIGAVLGEGWFRGRLTWMPGHRNLYGTETALLAQLEVFYTDGSSETIVTDSSWQAAMGPLRMSSIYDGETYDARLERDGWSTAGYNGDDLHSVRYTNYDLSKLVAPDGPGVRPLHTVKPIKIWQSPSGKTLVDFGQNLVGWVRIKVQGEAGRTLTFRYAEVLEKEELGVRPLRSAEVTDHYTLRGNGLEQWEPRFTFHGFRYMQIENWPGEVTEDALEAIVCHSDIERTGWLETSDELLNQLHQNVLWSMRGNFFDIPTDCPQRDERFGWTGDIQVFAPTAAYLHNSAGFLSSWLKDLAAEQKDHDGIVPVIVPQVLPETFAATAWGDAAVIVPWVLYQRYGDLGILEQQFQSMCDWVDVVSNLAGESRLWDTGFQFGDWLDPTAPPEDAAAAKTHSSIVATAYFEHSARLTGQIASLIGREQEAAHYTALADEVRIAFNNEYVTPAGRMMCDATTAYALALEFDLLKPEQRPRAAKRLAELVEQNKYRISTGFVGTPLMCDALAKNGYEDVAFRLLTERECPSWLYPVTMGATTIWERWDSMLPDGSINPGEMTSFNHYALGAVADWMHRNLGGLAPAAPGYRQIRFAPRPGGGVSSATARLQTPYGLAECAWQIEGEQIRVSVTVPANATATVELPQGETHQIGSGSYSWQYNYSAA
jgi:alpha-L-rhamnosidase